MTKSSRTCHDTNCLRKRARKKCIGITRPDRRGLLNAKTTKPADLPKSRKRPEHPAAAGRVTINRRRYIDAKRLKESIYEQNKRYPRNSRPPEQRSNGSCGR